MGKRFVAFILIFTFGVSHLYSQEDETEIPIPLSSELVEPTPKAPKPKNELNRKNWIFAGATIIAAALGIYVVVMDPGHRVH